MSSKIRFARSVLLCLVLAFTVFAPTSPVAAATDRLPDLGMARITDIQIEKTSNGRRLLRFTTTIVNIGSGPFDLRGKRPDSNTELMSVRQRIYNDAGGFRSVPTSAQMFFSGDGHNHWHVKDLESYDLIRMDNGVKVGSGAKAGFCFYDGAQYNSSLPGSPSTRVYPGCGRSSSLNVGMGLSVGWSDTYPWNLAFQYIDITGLTAGRYRLQITSDGNHWFLESNESNNVTWVDIQLQSRTGTSFNIIAYGPNV